MAFRTIKTTDYLIKFWSGDTEFVRLNLRDSNGDVMEFEGVEGTMGIKRRLGDDTYIMEKDLTFHEYEEGVTEFTIQARFSDEETVELLTYDGKSRRHLDLIYDIEIHDLLPKERTTLLSGTLRITKSIGGKV